MSMKMRMRAFISSILSLVLVFGIQPARVFGAASTVAGMQDGWAVDPSTGGVLLTAAKAQEMASGGAKWVRLHFRLGGHTTWDSALLATYDQVVANCRNAGLTIVGLVNNESWPGTQRD